MSFVWIPTPQLPQPNLPTPSVPSDTSFKVDVVANTVDWGGTLKYNTSNGQYDIVYEFDSLNVKTGIINTASVTNASINVLSANSVVGNNIILDISNIGNLTVVYGTTPNTPISNYSVVNKEYVDNAIISIAGGSGFDTTANLFVAKGDLLVGISTNTAVRLPVGSDGQVLSIDYSTPQKVVWKDSPRLNQSTFGMLIGSHEHPYRKQTTVQLRAADAIEMETGEFVTGWSNLTANLMTTGVGGRDTNSALAANTWYEVYAIYNPDTDDKGLLLHRSRDREIDQAWPPMNGDEWQFQTTATRVQYLRRSDTFITTPLERYNSKISQSFIPSVTAPLRAVDMIQSSTTGTAGFRGNVWMTIEPDDGSGNASGAVLATSRSFNIEEMSQFPFPGHYVFDTQAVLTQGDRYHIVMNGDWLINTATHSDANSMTFYGNLAPTQFPPNQQFWMASIGYSVPKPTSQTDVLLGFGDSRSYNVITGVWTISANMITGLGTGTSDLFFRTHMLTNNTAVVLPSGYTKKALISYACTNGSSRLKEYDQVNRTMMMSFHEDWRAWSANNQSVSFTTNLMDIRSSVPPVPCLARFSIICNADLVRYTPFTTYSGFIGATQLAPLRPFYPEEGRQQQIFITPEIDLSDLQVMLARDVTTIAVNGQSYYITSIRF